MKRETNQFDSYTRAHFYLISDQAIKQTADNGLFKALVPMRKIITQIIIRISNNLIRKITNFLVYLKFSKTK